jgi:hypothetical protein
LLGQLSIEDRGILCFSTLTKQGIPVTGGFLDQIITVGKILRIHGVNWYLWEKREKREAIDLGDTPFPKRTRLYMTHCKENLGKSTFPVALKIPVSRCH